MRKIVVTVPVFHLPECEQARQMLKDAGIEYVYCPVGEDNEEQFNACIGEVEAAIVASEPWDDAKLARAKNLKIVSRFGTGYDAVDLEAARKRGIDVTNTRVKEIIDGVAELAMGFIICALRDIPRLCAEAKHRNWMASKGTILEGKTVGLLGFGGIARSLAKRLKGFDVNILAYDMYPNAEAAEALGVTLTDMDTVLSQSDIVSLHVPSNAQTRHIMNRETFAKMKPTATFINTARGALVDEQALYEALRDGVIARAAIDVFEEEPTSPYNPLFTLDNFICTPHVAGNCGEAMSTNAVAAVQNVIDRFEGRELKTLVNP
ncbi:MAG: phosphoglycerate dehydrogenase [Clostridia bacterium]|nr:phosphoglycerate dehydrogenase [Clostridia bacterium]